MNFWKEYKFWSYVLFVYSDNNNNDNKGAHSLAKNQVWPCYLKKWFLNITIIKPFIHDALLFKEYYNSIS